MPQPAVLLVTKPFASYALGTIIFSPATIAAILAGPYAQNVEALALDQGEQEAAETLTVGVVASLVGIPISLIGTATNGTPVALDYSVDNGVSWAPVTNFTLAAGAWTGTGPAYATQQSGSIVVRDNSAQDIISSPASFTVLFASGTSDGTLTLSDGAIIAGIGTGLVATSENLAAAFGTITGSVADGGALSAETSARVSGDASNATMAALALSTASAALPASGGTLTGALVLAADPVAALQPTTKEYVDSATAAVASTAIPITQIGAASGVAPLDTSSHVPMANLPAIVGQNWSDIAASASIFRHGPVPPPPNPQAGLLFGDKFKIVAEYNFGEIWGPQQNYDAWPALQNFLLYAQLMALAMKTSSIDNIAMRNCVRVILPRGAYLVSQPLIIPEFVELDCRGTINRAAYTTDQSNNGTTSVPGPFATNQFLPTVVVVPRAHARQLNIYVNTDGNIAHRGSGVCIGKNWAAVVGAACTIGNAGSGYSVGDLLFMAQPSTGSYFNWAAQVISISSSGAITAATVHAAGAYALPPATYDGGPSLQEQQWAAANGFAVFDPANPGCFLVHSAYQSNGTIPSTGTGATLAPVWAADYVSGTAAYNIGSAITNGSQLGKIQITGAVPAVIDTVHGPSFCVMVTGLETVIGEIQGLGGNVGVYGYFCQDVRIGICNMVESGTGMEFYGCGSWHCPDVVLDTCGAALLINESQGIYIKGRAFFEQNNIGLSNVYPNSLGNAIQIGSASSASFPNADIHIDIGLVNMGGLPQSTINANPGTAVGGQTPRYMAASVFLAWLFSSHIDVKVTNIGEQGGLPTILPTSGFCQFGYGVDAGNDIRGSIDTVPTIDGTPPGPQLITLTSGHGWPGCAIRVWDGLHGGWCGPFGVYELYGSAAPANGTTGTGAGYAVPGSTFIDTASGAGRRYVNTGTLSTPTWS